jgi:hypothetical protein
LPHGQGLRKGIILAWAALYAIVCRKESAFLALISSRWREHVLRAARKTLIGRKAPVSVEGKDNRGSEPA